MRKTIFTPALQMSNMTSKISALLVLMMVMFGLNQAHAQCALACNKATQVSLDEDCEAEVTPSMILNADTTICPRGSFVVTVSHHGRPIPTSPVVTCANIGQTLEVMIRDVNSGNSCWGEITVEDKLAPQIECGSDTLFCYQMPKYTGPQVTDNCTKAAVISAILYSELEDAMDEVFGVDNWDEYNYLTVNPDDLLTCRYDVIYLDGFTINNIPLQNFVAANRTALENWVTAGGSLFINGSAFGGNFNLGFGGVTIGQFQLSDTAMVNDDDHPIFKGPFCPAVDDNLTGLNFFFFQTPVAATIICPPGMNPLLVSENGATLLLETSFGTGHVMFGTIIPSLLVRPEEEARNLRKNILHHLRESSPNKVEMTMLDERVFPYGCASDVFVKRIERDYVATDASGNTSTECTQTLYLRRFPIDAIECPKEWTLEDDCAIDCGGIETGAIPTLPNGAPTPEWAGVPTIDGIPLWPPNDFYCNVTVSYDDIVLPKVGCVTKVMRMWTISEWWCNTDIDTMCRQLMEIVDTVPPSLTCPDDITTTTKGGYVCEADVLLPPVNAVDLCSPVIRVDVKYPGGFLKEQNGGLVQLPVGIHEVVYYAYDDCYNLDSCMITVEVEDLTPPVAVCDRYTVVGLTYDSVAHVYAETFDDGTYDDCKIDSFAVKRMDDGAGCGVLQNQFRSYVEFCCADIGQNVMVIFRAYDKSGNFNDCMVEVEVQDKILPHIFCPPNITVSCDYHYDPSNLGASFGNVVDGKKNRQPIVLNDPNASADGPLLDGYAYDNCMLTIREDTAVNINQCNVGTLRRTFTATDANGSVSCTQTITFENFHPFNGVTDITWPASFDTTGCIDPDDLTEDITGVPTFNEDECDLVGYSFEDHVFPFFNAQQACLKIIRKWKVIDWCEFTFDPRTGKYVYTTYEHEQVIKVNDTIDPSFVRVTPDTMFCSFDTTCTSGRAELIATGDDSCTPGSELRWEYKIDINNTGVYDTTATGLGATIDASDDYPFGEHRIKYVFEDRCGNKITTERMFSIINCKAPTPYCKNGIVVDLMPIDTNRDGTVDLGMIEIWASDLDLGSFGACGNPVVLSFSADTNETNRTFDCDSLAQRNVEIWVTDRITGNQAFCRTFVIIQDNNGACSGTFNGGTVSGLVRMDDQQNVKDAEIELEGSQFSNLMTDADGSYAFPMMPFGGRYFVKPQKDDMHLDGISTKDLIIIQRHLLGITPMTSPYTMIAADVDADNEISIKDISQLRRLILGIYGELPDNDAWRFVNADYRFPNADDPFTPAFPEEYNIDQFSNTMDNVDFIAMKIGDVDNSVDASGLKSNGTRSAIDFNLEVADQEVTAGAEYTVNFKAKEIQNLTGYQFTLNFDAQVLEFDGVVEGAQDINEGNLGLNYLEDGMMTVSWNEAIAQSVQADDVLFSVRFRAYAQGQLSELISINSRMTTAEAYNQDTEVMNLKLNFSGQNASDVAFRLYQNHPNPFNDNTVIGFDLPTDGQVMLSIYDVTGKVVALYQLDGKKGYNSTEILSKDLTSTGVLYYQLDTQGYTATKKMVVLQ